VPDHPTPKRLGIWLGRFRRTAARVALAPAPAPWSPGDGIATAAVPTSIALQHASAIALAPTAAPTPEARGEAAVGSLSPLAPLAPHHEEGLRLAAAHRWNWAQRELERAISTATDESAAADLTSVREVRRQLRILRKWPRDVPAHVALGRAYMDLDLGPEAEAAFLRAIALAPTEPAAYGHLALEYGYRGELAAAERAYDRARVLGADLPPFAALLAEWSALPGAVAMARAPDAIPAGAGEGAAPRACGLDPADIPPRSREESLG